MAQIAFLDADWLAQMAELEALERLPRGLEVYAKARNIRVPQRGGERLVAEYVVNDMTGKAEGVELVIASIETVDDGGCQLVRKPVLDLCFAHACANYDKTGTKRLARDIRRIVMPDVKRLTAGICEAFFDDDENFDDAWRSCR